jgi:hypothetical protein
MTDVLILALATWRLASLLATEEGPYNAFARFRTWTGVEYDEYSMPQPRNEFARGLMCVWCNSVWVGLVLTVVYALFGTGALWLALPLALSAGAVIVERITGSDDG